ncbi:MAG: rhodanese-like domain-containing protein [Archangium sp.]
MNSEWWQWAVPVALVIAFVVFKRLGQISSEQARRLVNEGATLVDVRSVAEFSSGHLPGALNIPLGELEQQLAKLGAKERPVVLYCASGTRSAMARSKLQSLGFTQVFNLGSMGRW